MTILGSNRKDNRHFPYRGIVRQLSRFLKRKPTALTYPHDPELFETAYARLISNIEGYGNVLSEKHKTALRLVILQLTFLATGVETGRIGIPLPVGGGKTQAACCWAWAIWSLGLPLSVVIAGNKVDNLLAVKNELLKLGVDEAAIGVKHSKTDHPLPITDNNDQRQIMLVTHARVQGGDVQLADYAFYHGNLRSLMIYDESLITSDHWSMNYRDLVETVGGLREVRNTGLETWSPAQHGVFAYLEELSGNIRAEMERQQDGEDPREVAFPELTRFTATDLKGALSEGSRAVVGDAIDHAGGSARGLRLGGLHGSVWYKVTVPDEMQNIAVLDASLPIRVIPKINDQVREMSNFPSAIISYEHVQLNHLDVGLGRMAMNQLFDDNRKFRAFVAEIAHVIRNKIPEGEAVNLWTFKRRLHRDYVTRITSALSDHKIDLREELADGNRRFNFLTFGMETATNDYAYAPHTIFAGVMHREALDLTGAVVAGHRDLLLDQAHINEANQLLASETAHVLYQAAARSAIRYSNNGVARSGTIWLPIRTPGVMDLLADECFPGIQVRPWITRRGDWKDGETQAHAYARAIRDALDALPDDVDRIAHRSLQIEGEHSERAKRDGMNLIVMSHPDGWYKRARTWYRDDDEVEVSAGTQAAVPAEGA